MLVSELVMTPASIEPSRTFDPLSAQAIALVKRLAKMASEGGRENLLEGLRTELGRMRTAATTVVVCGETNRGKSALINALLARPGLLPVSAERSTGTHVVVRAPGPAEKEAIVAHRLGGDPLLVPLEDVADWVMDDSPVASEISWVEVVLEHPLLASGLTLVDSPGVGGLSRAHGQLALSALTGAEAGILVLDGGAPISAPELSFLEHALERVDDLVIALNRIDTQHGWRQVLSESADLLAEHASGRTDDRIFALSARMKSRADRLRASDPASAELAEELERASGVPMLSERLERWARARSGALRAARLCRLGEQVTKRLRAVELETRAARDATDHELNERLQDKITTRDGLARELPGARRRLSNEFRLLQREAEASLTNRVNSLRREFDRHLAEQDATDFENDLLAGLLKALEDSLEEVRGRLEVAERDLRDALGAYGAELPLESFELDWRARPELVLVQAPPMKAGGWQDHLGRTGSAAAMAIVNPLIAVAAVGALLFDRHRSKRRAQREQLSRQLGETVSEARSELGVIVHRVVVDGQAALTDALEEAAISRREELADEIETLQARTAQSQSRRAQEAAGVEERLRRLDELDAQLAHTGQAARAALRGAVRG